MINRWMVGEEGFTLAERCRELRAIRLRRRQVADLEMIASGGFSPLDGFMGRADYLGVLEEMRLGNGQIWPLPVTLAVRGDEAAGLREGQRVSLADDRGLALGVLDLKEVYRYDKASEAMAIYGRLDDDRNPGMSELRQQGDVVLAGQISVFRRPSYDAFAHYRLDPAELHEITLGRDWRTVVAVWISGPALRDTEYLIKSVLETVDGVVVHVPLGQASIAHQVKYLRSVELMIRHYLPSGRVALIVVPEALRHSRGRDSVLQALISRNYGCSRLLVIPEREGERADDRRLGAASIFSRFQKEELGIEPIILDRSFYCEECRSYATAKTCPHDTVHHTIPNSQYLGQVLLDAADKSWNVVRPEIASLLTDSA